MLQLGTGKLYHEKLPPNGDGANSWTNSSEQFSCTHSSAGGAGTYCDPKMQSCKVGGEKTAPNPRWCAVDCPLNGTGAYFEDLATLADAQAKMRFAAANRNATALTWRGGRRGGGGGGRGQPFFLGVGLRKPHLDWRFPKPFLGYYPNASATPLARHPVVQQGRPAISYHGPWRSVGERALWRGWGWESPYVPMRPGTAGDMRRHYYAATSFMDSVVGRLLGTLEELQLVSSTVVCFHSGRSACCASDSASDSAQCTVAAPHWPSIHPATPPAQTTGGASGRTASGASSTSRSWARGCPCW